MNEIAICQEAGHRFALRKIKKHRELSIDDHMILLLLFVTIVGIPLILLYLWYRTSITSYYEICERCGTIPFKPE